MISPLSIPNCFATTNSYDFELQGFVWNTNNSEDYSYDFLKAYEIMRTKFKSMKQ